MDKLGDFAVGRSKRKRIYGLAQFVCVCKDLYFKTEVSTLRNTLEKPIIGKRGGYHHSELSFCRKTFMSLLRKHQKLRP